MKLLGERNWYLQRRLERLPRFEFGEPSVAPEAAPPAVASASLLKRIPAADRHGRDPDQALLTGGESLTGALSRSTFLASFGAKGFCRLRQPGFAAHS
jgi:hypothetical protein